MLEDLKIVALSHKQTDVRQLGLLHLDEESQKSKLNGIQKHFSFDELMFLSTCNRVELIVKSKNPLPAEQLVQLFQQINPELTFSKTMELANAAVVYENMEAVRHLFHVASSLDSMVVGEREIITQVRKAYEICLAQGLTGDLIRLLIKQTIETAKFIYTETNISRNPVSVVSLAYRQLRELNISNHARVLIIGAGETNTTMAKYLNKHKYANFVVFNRTLAKAEILAKELNGKAYSLNQLTHYKEGFDVLITCTSATEPIITKENYTSLLNGETDKKTVIDLAIPNDVSLAVVQNYPLHYVEVNTLQEAAKENMKLREKEIITCEHIVFRELEKFESLYQERKIELAFGEIPKKVKEIKETALNEVFAKEVNGLDSNSKEVLEKVISYMEKKYNAVAMKTAKEALLD